MTAAVTRVVGVKPGDAMLWPSLNSSESGLSIDRSPDAGPKLSRSAWQRGNCRHS